MEKSSPSNPQEENGIRMTSIRALRREAGAFSSQPGAKKETACHVESKIELEDGQLRLLKWYRQKNFRPAK